MRTADVQRHRRVAVLPVALVVAVAAVVLLVALPAPTPLKASAQAGALTLTQAWPKAKVGTLATLPDGSPYQPLMIMAGATALVLAPSADRNTNRLMLMTASTAVTLGTAATDAPGFTAVTAAGGRIYWAKTVPDAAGDAKTELWTATATGTGVRELVADAGVVVFNRSQYDLQIEGGRLRWLVAVPGSTSLSARSVPIDDGPMEQRPVPAGFAAVAWPWFSDVGAGSGAAPALYDAESGRRVAVKVPAGAVAECSSVWCQVQRSAAGAPAGVELVRPDGSGRLRVAGAGTATPVVDVGLLGRFEVLSVSAPAGATGTPPQQVLLYDARHRRTAELAAAATTVQARDGFVWWSVGAGEGARWSWLNLSTLD